MSDAFDLLTPAALADPFPIYRQLREADPVHWSEGHGGWLVTRYDDVAAALRDPRFSAARSAAMFERMPPAIRDATRPLQRAFTLWMLMMDPPDHTRLRGLVSKALAPSLALADEVVFLARPELPWDAGKVIEAAVPAALKKAQPGTPEFRAALRDALEQTKGVAGAHGVFTMSPTDHLGIQNGVVMVKIENGTWKYQP